MRVTNKINIAYLALFLAQKFFIQFSVGSALPHAPFSIQKIRHFLRNKCQNPFTQNAAIWSYEGRLVDPTNGNVIANVEGIELVRTLTEIARPLPSNGENSGGVWNFLRGLRRLDDLKVRSMLADPGWDYAGTILSRKLFCYSSIHDKDGGLMKEYRLHPTAPLRKLKTEDVVALYDTVTTFISTQDGEGMVVMTEWPDGHWIQSDASSIGGMRKPMENEKGDESSSGRKYFEFTVYARRSGRNETPVLPPYLSKTDQNAKGDSTSVHTVPPRSKFIQFGRDDNTEDRRYGARETYSYLIGSGEMTRGDRLKSILREGLSNLKERVGLWDCDLMEKQSNMDPHRSCTVRYTRYGEAPAWYGPGKMCTLELWGRRVDSVADTPPLAATFAATRIPGFLSVHASIPTGPGCDNANHGTKPLSEKQMREQQAADEAAIKAVSWFRGREASLPLEILKEDDHKESRIETVVNIGLSLAQKVRAATSATSPVEL
jgi:hypothetical protein